MDGVWCMFLQASEWSMTKIPLETVFGRNCSLFHREYFLYVPMKQKDQ